MTQLLIEMAQTAVEDTSLLASHINRYGKREGLQWEEIAQQLQIDSWQLAKLALCRQPRRSRFSADVARIADYVGMNGAVLGLFVQDEGDVERAWVPVARRRSLPVLSRGRVWALGFVALALLVIGAVAFIQPRKNEATLVVSEGQAIVIQSPRTILAFGQREHVMAAGDVISVSDSDQIAVSAGSTAQLRLFDGSTVALSENTTVQVAELNTTEDTYRVHLNMLSGKTISRVRRLLSLGDAFKISTPSSTASVRGTVFTVEVLGADTTFISCDEGSVEVETDGRQAMVPAGTQLLTVVGEPMEVESQADGTGGSPEAFPTSPTGDVPGQPVDIVSGERSEAVPEAPAGDVRGEATTVAPDKVQEPVVGTSAIDVDSSPADDLVARPAGEGLSEPAAASVAGSNRRPVANDDRVTTPEDTPASVPVLDNDSAIDSNLDPTTVSTIRRPANGSLTIKADGTISYVPDADFHGSDAFVYQVCDPDGQCDIATVSITVVPVNDRPHSADDSASTLEDTLLTLGAADILGNDSDVDGDTLVVNLLAEPGNGSLTQGSRVSFSYQPNANFHGSDSFAYEACDRAGLCDMATLNITVLSVNDRPVAQDDSATTKKGTPLIVGVLSNDSDVDGDRLVIGSATDPGHGTTSIRLNTQLTYTPDADFSGIDTFSYEACDPKNECDTATVTVSVNPINRRPVAHNDSAYTPEDTLLLVTAPGVLGNDFDSDGDLLAANLLSGPSHGKLSLGANGFFNYTPESDFHGSDSFTYEACDLKELCAAASVVIRVVSLNDPPVAADDEATTAEDSLVWINAAANDTDVDGNLELASARVLNSPSHGRISGQGFGSFSYLPNANYFGNDSFTYQICDMEGWCDTAAVNVRVAPVNDRPVAFDDGGTTPEDIALTFTISELLGNDTDADGDTLLASLMTGPSHGSLTPGIDGSFSYVPDVNFNGRDELLYEACDPGGLCDSASFVITVTPKNDPPVAFDDSATTAEDSLIVVNVAANDSDVDDILDPAGSAIVSGPASGVVIHQTNGAFSYLPEADFFGQDRFTYQICDPAGLCDSAVVSIAVTSVNDPPVAHDDTARTDVGVMVVIDVAANDTDVDGNLYPAGAVILTDPAHGSTINHGDGTFSYLPAPDYFGNDHFVYQICDTQALCDTAQVRLQVTPVNDRPVARDDAASTVEESPVVIDVQDNDSAGPANEDAKLFTASVSDPSNGGVVINPNQRVTYTPNLNFYGVDRFTYTVCDRDSLCDSATVTVVIGALNDPPLAVDDRATTAEDSSLGIQVTANDIDVDGNLNPAGAIVLSNPAHGTLSPQGNGSFGYSPDADFFGSDRFTYQVCDLDGLCDMAVVSVQVTPVNDRPMALDDSGRTLEGSGLTISVTDLLGNDSDVDGDILVVNLMTAPGHGSLSEIAGGSFSYLPDPYFNGIDAFGYEACDPGGLCDPATFTIHVTPKNDPPVAVDDGYVTAQDSTLTIDDPLLGVMNQAVADFDPDGDAIYVDRFDAVGSFGGTVLVNPNGTFSYSPPLGFSGFDSFGYSLSDGNGGTASATVTIEVTVKNGRGVGVSWGDWTLSQSNLNGMFNIQNESGQGYPVQLLSHEILVEYRESAPGNNVWIDMGVTGCTADAAMPVLLADQMVIHFYGCHLAATVPTGATVRVTAVVKIYGHKAQGGTPGVFQSGLSKVY